MKIILLNSTPNPEKTIALAARLCYTSSDIENLNNKLTDDTIKQMINKLIENNHESPFEHVSFTFGIEGISRACYDKDTMILTDNGWKYFKDIKDNEIVATMNPESKKVEFHKINEKIEYEYNGDMHRYKSQNIDLLITPNHNLYYKKYDTRKKVDYELKASEDISVNRFYMTKKFDYENTVSDNIIIPGYEYQRKNNSGGYYTKRTDDLNINRADFYKFLAWYISEGSTYYNEIENSYSISISQKKESNIENIKKIISNIGFKCSYAGSAIKFKSLTLGKFLSQLGYSNEKYIPFDIFKDFNKSLAEIFLKEYILGDGTIDENNCEKIYTTSKILSEQLYNLCYIAGYTAIINIDDRIGQERILNGKKIKSNYVCYVINLSKTGKRNHEIVIKKDKHFTKETYNDKVYCVDVKNHIIFIKRNDIAIWCGNCSHQLVRSRLASHCLSGDTKILRFNQNKKHLTIKELYERQCDSRKKQYNDNMEIRSMNENGIIVKNKIKEVIYSGKKNVYELTTELGYKIKSSDEHIFFNNDGEIKLKNIKIGDDIYVNGIELYKDKEWFEEKYNSGYSTTQIAELCNIAPCTARKWKRIHKIKNSSKYKSHSAWNKGITGELSHMFGFKMSEESKILISKSKKGELNPQYKDNIADLTDSGVRRRVHKMTKEKCALCGGKELLENHHIDKNIRNIDKSNVLCLCRKCHNLIHHGYNVKKVILDKVVSIKLIGIEDTYDIEMYEPYHNFVANGFIVHNSQQSQRYVKETQFDYVIPNTIEEKGMKNIFEERMQTIQSWYSEAINNGIPAEDARFYLPNACETKIIMTMNARELINFLHHRLCSRAQWEIRELAYEILLILRKECPLIFNHVGAGCFESSCPEKTMTCGKCTEMRKLYSIKQGD